MNQREIKDILYTEFKKKASIPQRFAVFFRPPLQAEEVMFMVRVEDWQDKVFYADSPSLADFAGMCRVNKRLLLHELAGQLASQYVAFQDSRIKARLKEGNRPHEVVKSGQTTSQAVLIPIEKEEVPF